MFSLLHLLVRQLRRLFADRRELVLENLALRQQLLVYQRQLTPRFTIADRFFWVWLSRFWSGWRSSLFVVKPQTVVGAPPALEALLVLEESTGL
jgi:hypothetical protein